MAEAKCTNVNKTMVLCQQDARLALIRCASYINKTCVLSAMVSAAFAIVVRRCAVCKVLLSP